SGREELHRPAAEGRRPQEEDRRPQGQAAAHRVFLKFRKRRSGEPQKRAPAREARARERGAVKTAGTERRTGSTGTRPNIATRMKQDYADDIVWLKAAYP